MWCVVWCDVMRCGGRWWELKRERERERDREWDHSVEIERVCVGPFSREREREWDHSAERDREREREKTLKSLPLQLSVYQEEIEVQSLNELVGVCL